MTLIELVKELQKPEYAAMTNEQAFDALRALTVSESNLIPATTVNQMFAKLDLTGVIDDIAATQGHPFRHKMSSVNKSIIGNHPFNFTEGTAAGDGNLLMLDAMIANIPEHAAKLSSFKESVYQLANFKRKYPTVALVDVIAARSVQLDGLWHELPATDGRTFSVTLTARTPEPTRIIIEMQDLSGEFEYVQAIGGVQSAKGYSVQLPHYGQPRKIRWKCEYSLVGNVAVQ